MIGVQVGDKFTKKPDPLTSLAVIDLTVKRKD